MIDFRKEGDYIIATYSTKKGDSTQWVYEKFDLGEEFAFNKTYTFSKKDLYSINPKDIEEIILDPFNDPGPIDFLFAVLEGEYFKVINGVLVNLFDIFIHKNVEIGSEFFVAESYFPIFREIERLIKEDIYIGGTHPNAIPEETFMGMIYQFPSPYEKRLYAEARLSAIIKEFFTTTRDAEQKFEKYRNKKTSKKGIKLRRTFQKYEAAKFQTIYDKLISMLEDENNYSEHQWQKEILEIILLLSPKYIHVFTNVPIKTEETKDKFLDFLLVDSNGNIDIIEIKKPFENAIMTKNYYRDNFIPLRELSGTVMQIEKYIYFLNRWGEKGEKYLTNKYIDKLPPGFEIKITNPGGIIIMGRENNLTLEQKADFEVVKRKYKNIVDIITYDNLLERLRFTIEQIKPSNA